MMEKRSVVALVKCPDYSPDTVQAAVTSALELADITTRIPAGRVLIKPNLLSARSPDEAVTTHPAVVQAVGEIALSQGARLSIGDSPPFAGESAARYARLCEQTGTTAAAAELGAELVRFEDGTVTVNNPSGRFYKTFEVARAVADADLVISVSKLKTHGLTMFTGAVKNLFGCIPGIRKGLCHVQAAEDRAVFAQMLVDLMGALKPAIHVMDAVVGLEGEGPNAGDPRQIGLILASDDPVALDAVACAVVGIDPLSIDTIRLAHEQGLGRGDMGRIETRGERLDDVRVEGFRQSSGRNDWARIPAPIRRMLRRQLIASPRIDSAECIGCADCARACPVRAITPGRPPSIDLSACIRCYCCHEVCDTSAINLRRGWVGILVSRLMQKG